MKELTALLVCVLAYFLYTHVIRKQLFLRKVASRSGTKYLVRNLPDQKDAANLLDELGGTLVSLIEGCGSEKGERKAAVERVRKKFDPTSLTENIPGSSHVAYSVNKGSELSICLRHKDTEEFHDINTIRFVAIHELAHIMSKSSGHTDEFWDNMKFLLEKARGQGLYTPVDYAKHPVTYCGMDITSTPLDM